MNKKIFIIILALLLGSSLANAAKTRTLFTDITGTNIGIGTSAPDALLHVAGDTKIEGNLLMDGRSIDRTGDVALSTVTVANTTTETTLWTASVPANSLTAGNVFKIHADGIVSNGGPSAGDQITIRVRVGGVEKIVLEPVTKTLTGVMWHIDANATQRTIGATGSRAMHIHLVIGEDDEVHSIGVGAIDTTANMDVTITAQWASADAANTISLYQGFMEYKN